MWNQNERKQLILTDDHNTFSTTNWVDLTLNRWGQKRAHAKIHPVVVNPRMWRTQLGATDVKEALPELRKDFVVDPLNGFGVATKTGRPDELDAMFEALRLEKVTSIAAVGIRGMLAEPARDVWEHDGLCSCGKKTYLFSRCPACIEKEAQEEVVEMQERAEAAAEDRDVEDDLDLALEWGRLWSLRTDLLDSSDYPTVW